MMQFGSEFGTLLARFGVDFGTHIGRQEGDKLSTNSEKLGFPDDAKKVIEKRGREEFREAPSNPDEFFGRSLKNPQSQSPRGWARCTSREFSALHFVRSQARRHGGGYILAAAESCGL